MPIGTVRKSRRQSCPRLFSYTLFLSYKTFSVPASLSIVAALAGFPACLTVSKHPFLFICQFQRMIITKTDRQPYVGTMQKVFDIMTFCHMNVHSLPAFHSENIRSLGTECGVLIIPDARISHVLPIAKQVFRPEVFCLIITPSRHSGYPFYLLLFIKSTAQIMVNDTWEITPPDVAVLYKPGQRHLYRANHTEYEYQYCLSAFLISEVFPHYLYQRCHPKQDSGCL